MSFPKSHNLPGGLGTALKPAHEPIVVARKPLIGTVAETVSRFGTGALAIDRCRIGSESTERPNGVNALGVMNDDGWEPSEGTGGSPAGRWPANVVLDEAAAAELDRQSGEQKSGTAYEPDGKPMERSIYGATGTLGRELGYGDTGGASRFFYIAKASRAERNAGLDGFEERAHRRYGEQGQGPNPQQTPRVEQVAANVHPTVKPVDLMRWLCRLVTPPGGTVLDPFAGSGTTGIACVLEDFDFIGIEREAEYVEIAKARIDYWAKQPKQLGLLDAA